MQSTLQHVHATNLGQESGYPLRNPQLLDPPAGYSEPYVSGRRDRCHRSGRLQYGQFTLFFNVDPPSPPSAEFSEWWRLPDLLCHHQTSKRALEPDTVLMTGVTQVWGESSYEFTATGETGAILILPDGATSFELEDKYLLDLREHVAKYASEWCRYRDSLLIKLPEGGFGRILGLLQFKALGFLSRSPGGSCGQVITLLIGITSLGSSENFGPRRAVMRNSNRAGMPRKKSSTMESTEDTDSYHSRLVIMEMRLENFDIGHIDAGVCVLVHFETTTRRTQSKPHAGIIEWYDEIMLLSDVTVYVTVCGVFQLGSILGTREIYARQSINTSDMSGSMYKIKFFFGNSDSRSSLLVTLGRHYSYWEPYFSHQGRRGIGRSVINGHGLQGTSVFVEKTTLGFKAFYSYHLVLKEEYLEIALECFRGALEQSGLDDPCRATACFNLATSEFVRCQVHGTYSELDKLINLYREALELREEGHPDRHATLLLLAQALLSRLACGEEYDRSVAEDIELLLTDLHHDNDRDRRTADVVLATCRFYRSIHAENPDEIDALLKDLERGAYVPPYGYYDRPHLLHKMGAAYWRRFLASGKIGDLDKSIELNVKALQVPDGHEDRQSTIACLGHSLLCALQVRVELMDLDMSISLEELGKKVVTKLNDVIHAQRPEASQLQEQVDLVSTVEKLRKQIELMLTVERLQEQAELMSAPDKLQDQIIMVSAVDNVLQDIIERWPSPLISEAQVLIDDWSREEETPMECKRELGMSLSFLEGEGERGMQDLLEQVEPQWRYKGYKILPLATMQALQGCMPYFRCVLATLRRSVQRYHYEALLAARNTTEAREEIANMLVMFADELHTKDGIEVDVVILDLKDRCVGMLTELGDIALEEGKHDEAIDQYTSALYLSPSNPVDIFLGRSKARASKSLWKEALMDANEAIDLDSSSHRPYEREFTALVGMEDYGEANNALVRMLSIIEISLDEGVRRLRTNYVRPRETTNAVKAAIQEIHKHTPLVLIDVTSGQLCNAAEREKKFTSEAVFQKLISETATTKLDHKRIIQTVAQYFKWVMFSHTWEGEEPTFDNVHRVKSVWELDKSDPLNEKLRQFCRIVREDGYRWAWSDTCCIDKRTNTILSQSLTSMFSWYEEGAATLVYLADEELESLTMSRWMTRSWTLQELLASRVVRFYTRNWKPYLNDTHFNHKESPAIKQELARAMGVAPETITSFRPEVLGVQDKLRLASTRNAAVEEDTAYSLIGIFSSNIIPRYGVGKIALGELLENIVARTGDVTVICWTGKSSPYNSSLPDSLSVYRQVPYSPLPMEDDELNTHVDQLRTRYPTDTLLPFYYKVDQLPRASFANRCLQLPCLTFPVSRIGVQQLGGSDGTLYRATVSLFGKMEFRTADVVSLDRPRKLLFVHPWIHELVDSRDGSVSDNETDVDSDEDRDSNDGSEATSDAGSAGDDGSSVPISPMHAEPAPQLDPHTSALRFIARLGRPFNALLLEQHSKGRYKRIAAENVIVAPGIPQSADLKKIRVKVLEVI